MPNIIRKSGSDIRQLIVKLSVNAWLLKPSMNNSNKIKKENGNIDNMTPLGNLPHTTLTSSSWK
jgi:hypothetical protein